MSKQNEHRAAVRNYKDSVFRMIFSDKKELLALYNALNGSHYTDPEILTIKTLENAIYMNIKNDLSFLLHDGLYLYEHQSTFNPNMPLRDYALYVEKVRSYSQTMETDEAVEKAVTECIKDDILKEFLLRQRAEAVKVTIYEFDQEQHNQTLREEGYVEGHAEGLAEGLAEGREKGIEILIRTCKKHNATKEEILSSLREEYDYGTDEEAMEKINLYW